MSLFSLPCVPLYNERKSEVTIIAMYKDERETAMMDEQHRRRRRQRSTLLTGICIGIGIAGFLDEALVHQILQWHNFYWATSEYGRILSDGFFHIFSTLLLLYGLFRVWRERMNGMPTSRAIMIAGILIGAGGFNFYDGIVQHAILHLHLVNEHVCDARVTHNNNTLSNCPQDIPYEIVWDAVGFVVLAAGFLFWRRASRIV